MPSNFLDIEDTRWLLAHAYDNAALTNSEMVAGLPVIAEVEPQQRASTARSILLDAIEFLRPPRNEPIRSPASRAYAVLWLRYVEGMAVPQVGTELGLSERQTHRELRAAEAKLADVLQGHLLELQRAKSVPRREPEEESAITTKPVHVELQELLQSALSTVELLAQRMQVKLELADLHAAGKVFLDGGVLRQLLIQAFSLAIQQTVDGTVHVSSSSDGGTVIITTTAAVNTEDFDSSLQEGLRHLIEALQLENCEVRCEGGWLTLKLSLQLRQPKDVLVVDDNTSTIELYRRYLEPTGEWRVIGITEPRLVYDMARSIKPALVILDLLIPGSDGWTILNMLHAQEATANIPVIVCSVFQDRLLAEALGAKAYLQKPVSQAQLLSATRTWAR